MKVKYLGLSHAREAMIFKSYWLIAYTNDTSARSLAVIISTYHINTQHHITLYRHSYKLGINNRYKVNFV